MVKTQVLLLGANLKSPNQGVNALSIGTIYALLEKFGNTLSVCILNLNTNTVEKVFCLNGVQIPLRQVCPGKKSLLWASVMALFSKMLPISLRHAVIEKNYLLRLIDGTELVIDLSEGDSFSEIYGTRRLLKHFFYKLPVILLNKPLFIFPQTLGPFETKIGQSLAKYVFRHAEKIFPREVYSLQIVEDLLGKDKDTVVLAADMAFLMQPETSMDILPLLNLHSSVGINVSGLLYHGELEGLRWSTEIYKEFTTRIISKFVEDFDRDVILIPHVVQLGNKTNDLVACQVLKEALPLSIKSRVYVLEEPLTAPQLKGIISQVDFFVGARMHSCIAALSSCVPTIAVSYSHKFEGILELLESAELVCNPQTMSLEEMIERVESCYNTRYEIRKKLQRLMPSIKDKALSVILYLDVA